MRSWSRIYPLSFLSRLLVSCCSPPSASGSSAGARGPPGGSREGPGGRSSEEAGLSLLLKHFPSMAPCAFGRRSGWWRAGSSWRMVKGLMKVVEERDGWGGWPCSRAVVVTRVFSAPHRAPPASPWWGCWRRWPWASLWAGSPWCFPTPPAPTAASEVGSAPPPGPGRCPPHGWRMVCGTAFPCARCRHPR